jgi:hypothetical protein
VAHDLERGAAEFRDLVEEQHAVVREADLSRLRQNAPAGERDLADSVVRRAKRPRRDDAGVVG